MSQVIWAPSARLDLAKINDYLDQHDGAAAVRILLAIRQAADRLSEFPHIGWVLDEPLRVFGVRRTPYNLIYRIVGADIEIARIRHRRTNWFAEPLAS